MKTTVFWDVVQCSLVEVYRRFRSVSSFIISLMMKAASTSETSVNFNQTTWRDILEDSQFIPTLVQTNNELGIIDTKILKFVGLRMNLFPYKIYCFTLAKYTSNGVLES
jgi:hypothetical protein